MSFRRTAPFLAALATALITPPPPASAQHDDRYLQLGATPLETRRAWLDACQTSHIIRLPAPQTQTVELTTRVERIDTPHVDFVLPTWRPGKYIVLDFAGSVSRVRATDTAGKPLPWEKRDKTTWRVTTNGSDTVELHYRVYANELSDRTRHVDDTHAFLSGSSVFMLVRERRAEPQRVLVEAPPGWRTTTGLDAVPGHEGAFIAPDYDVLIDAPLEIGTHTLRSFEVDGRPIEIAIWGAGNWDADKLVADFEPLVRTQIDFWQHAPFGRYVFLLHATTGASGGTEHLNSTIMQRGRDSFAPARRYRRVLSLTSHEFFHTWNVKRLRPAGLNPYDVTRENYTDLLWVAEGTTSYYTPVLLVRAGLLTPMRYLGQLADSIDDHLARPGRLVQSVEQSSFDAWIKFNKPDRDATNTTVSFYREGALASLVLDMEIRARTDNAGSLDEVLRRLYRRFPLSGPGYTRADLLATINEVSGSDFTDFFDRHISGTEPLPLAAALAHAGLELVEESADADEDDGEDDDAGDEENGSEDSDDGDDNGDDDSGSNEAGTPSDDADGGDGANRQDDADKGTGAPKPAPYLGLELRGDGDFARVRTVLTDGPAFDAGVQVDDVIIALDGRRLPAGDLEQRIEAYAPGGTVCLTIVRRDMLREIAVELAGRPEVTRSIRRVDEPTDLQRAIYESWLDRDWPE